eukprot:CAMPEP_0177289304 /NCGR_PEP_ID=MMETSP0367-20130122/75138_1 /TAXON_ID=447022 ORGANISM="Scrippsiella hangoei-like, Strain SHHI-4" /NCGR_SAMPLE_ID=MMETSP0367 /ASSEMBLY_ACC=CAM_ASM_000362 /LENGTH=91 /DNA_ID=CAMNT_0018746715 /DNA_START=151 /DNA_END=424 /DNA_ORIENTATION=+
MTSNFETSHRPDLAPIIRRCAASRNTAVMESHRCTSGQAGRPHGALRPTLAVPNSELGVVQADARALRFESAAACHTAQPANEADREPPPD